MYLVYIIDQIRHLMNEPKKLIFAYNSDRREYIRPILWGHVSSLRAVYSHIKKYYFF
jgi:hypothetical protein